MLFEGEIKESRKKKKSGRFQIKIETSRNVFILDFSGKKKFALVFPFFLTLAILTDWVLSIPQRYELEKLRFIVENKRVENEIMIKKVAELKKEIKRLQNIQESMLYFIEEKKRDKNMVIQTSFSPEDELSGEEALLKKMSQISEGFRKVYEELMRRKLILDYLPTIKPTEKGYISSGFGYRIHPILKRTHFHTGVDISAPKGTKVFAAASGKVVEVSRSKNNGLYIKIKHINGIETAYTHLSQVFVKRGEFVEKGEIIGLVGNSGRTTGPNLHYEVHFRGKPINPLIFMVE